MNAQFLTSSNVHAEVILLLQYTYPLMIAQDWVESPREPINYGRYHNIDMATQKDKYKNILRKYVYIL